MNQMVDKPEPSLGHHTALGQISVSAIRLVLIIGSGSPGPLQFPLDTSLGSPPPLTGHWIGLNTPVQKASFLVCCMSALLDYA